MEHNWTNPGGNGGKGMGSCSGNTTIITVKHSLTHFLGSVCSKCGITAASIDLVDSPCPPWKEKAKGENNNAEWGHEAEIIRDLKMLNLQVTQTTLLELVKIVQKLIQTRDACVKKSTK